MARITDRLLVQRADDRMVVLDESSGAEIDFPISVVRNVIQALTYLMVPCDYCGEPGREISEGVKRCPYHESKGT